MYHQEKPQEKNQRQGKEVLMIEAVTGLRERRMIGKL